MYYVIAFYWLVAGGAWAISIDADTAFDYLGSMIMGGFFVPMRILTKLMD